MNLVIDVGNTLVKSAVFQDDTLLKKKVFIKQDFVKNLEETQFNFPQVQSVLFSTVGKSSKKWLPLLSEKYKVITLDPLLPQVFNNKYATPITLGNDRIALASAATKFYPNKNVLVIDCGSCITYDLKTNKNDYLGGAISPGLEMRYKALHTFTEKLPLLEAELDAVLVGNSTKSSMHSGVINGITAEMDGMIDRYQSQYEDLTIILTGGDAQILCKRLKNGIFANSNFLLEGLNYILEFNKSQ